MESRRSAGLIITVCRLLLAVIPLLFHTVHAQAANHPPTVTLTAPAANAKFTTPATITVTAQASDPDVGGSVKSVTFYAEGVVIGVATRPPYTITWSNVAKGTYSLTASATDDLGATGTSARITISVVDPTPNLAPAITLTSPASGATFNTTLKTPATISLAATAADPDGTLTRVDFYADNTLIGSKTTTPYTASWTQMPAGTYSITAVATDNGGRATRSNAAAVTVVSSNKPPVVALTSPTSTSSFFAPANITLTASATDPDPTGRVTSVKYFNGSTLIGTAAASPYTVTWNNVAAGAYLLTAVATDDELASTTSTALMVTVSVPKNIAPKVSFTTPKFGAIYSAPGTISLSASATDTDGTVKKVEYYSGATLVGSSVTAPFNVSWTSVPSGTYFLTAIATDNLGATGRSLPLEVTVNPKTTAIGSTLATYQFSKGWATFGLALPPGAASAAVKVGTLLTQTDVKTTWSDGSIRFAVVTAKIDTAGSYPITSAAFTSGTFGPKWPTATVTFATGGQTFVATLPLPSSADSWLWAGPLVHESRVLVTPTSGGTAHQLLQVIFDVRSYTGGGNRVDITVQNVEDVALGGPVTYDVAITINGSSVYSASNVTQAYLTRWRKVFTSGLTESAVVPDFTPFYQARALPQYLSTVVDPVPVSTGSKFAPLQFGDMNPDMASPGGRPEIAPYPNWVAQYLVHKRPEQRAYMLASADLSGSWAGHITLPDGITPIDLDLFPNYWLDGRAGTNTIPSGGLTGPNATRININGGVYIGDTAPMLETAHMPSLTFVPYLVTGDRYYLDQTKFWANFTLLNTWDSGQRQGGMGILVENQPRGIGWALRNIADAAAYVPDYDPMHEYFRSRLQNNLDFFENYALTKSGGPFEFLFVRNGYPQTPDDRVTSLWMNSYIGWALDRAEQHGFGPVAAMRDRIVRVQALFFNSDSAGYPRQPSPQSQDGAAMGDVGGAPYYPTVGRVDASGVFHFFTTMKEIHDASWIADPRGSQFAGYYGPEARLMLQIGVRNGVVGSQAALTYLLPFITGDLNFRSGWAIAP